MKELIWLTVLQALVVNAVPYRMRQACSNTSVVVSTVIAAAPIVTLRAAPQTTVDAKGHSITAEVLVTSIVEEASNGIIFVSESEAPVNNVTLSPVAPTGKSQAQATSSSPPSTAGASDSDNSVQTQSPAEAISSSYNRNQSTSNASAPGGIFPASVSTSSVAAHVSVITTSISSGTAQILPSLSTQSSDISGIILTRLNTTGLPASGPLISTSISAPTTTLLPTALATSITSSITMAYPSDDIFQPVATDAPPSVIGARPDHPVPRLGIQPQQTPIGTNKFYANFFLGSQQQGTWTHPYSVAWSKGAGSSQSWGMSISHIDADQRVYGPNATANPVEYYINPVGIQSLVLSALELGASTNISIDSITAFSANVNLLPRSGAAPAVTFPLVQGMGFVTGIYNGGTPILQTGVFFRSITQATINPKPGVTKYTILLEDGKTWLLYAYSPTGASLDFTVVNNGLAQANSNFNGIIQIAKNPGGGAEDLYDSTCGAYPTTVTLSGAANGSTASYTLSFSTAGLQSTTLVMFALPHHIESFSPQTASAVTNVQLNTTTKGLATAVVADSWTLIENLPTTMGFAPWSPSIGSEKPIFSAGTIATILGVATSEVSQNMSQQTNLNSMYYSGKALAKFAGIVYTINDLLGDTILAQAGLANLKSAFAVFASNQQQYPLVHETAWGGVVSNASYETGNSGDDFGNTYYNDHHFHYGYFIFTAAIIGYLDPTWLPANAPYVNTLVRDMANPSTLDPYFPVFRMFDWFHGHSWAQGLYESGDGKDEESSSEDTMSAYAIKMWGHTTGDANMEARGNLQLALTARSLQNYFLYTSTNTIESSNFINNKVSGILFENKIDHTTYFGTNIEYIQGIHMLPLLPSSTLTRTQTFVQQEWDAYFSNGRADAVTGGWKGILYANYAIVNPVAAWNFFSQAGFDASWLDGGASQTWYLALAAGLGGAP